MIKNAYPDNQQFHVQTGLRREKNINIQSNIFLVKIKVFMPSALFTDKESYPKTLLLQRKHKRLVIIWVQISHFNGCLFFLSNSFPFTVKKFNLNVGVWW